MLPPSSLVLSRGWGLIDLPLRASNEGSLRPRVARAQKIIRPHPLLNLHFLLGYPHQFLGRRHSMKDFLCALILQGHHPLCHRCLTYRRRVGLGADEAADFIVQDEELKNAGSPAIPSLGTG